MIYQNLDCPLKKFTYFSGPPTIDDLGKHFISSYFQTAHRFRFKIVREARWHIGMSSAKGLEGPQFDEGWIYKPVNP